MQKKPVLIVSAGMPRSGSTWLFNAVRLLLRACPGTFAPLGSGWYQDHRGLMANRHVLLKMHFHEAPVAGCARAIFYSYRDIRDAMASQQRRFGGPAQMAWADEYVRSHEEWMRCADFTLEYEHMLHGKEEILAGLAEVIRRKFMTGSPDESTAWNAADIIAEIAEMSYDSPGPRNPQYNEVTLFHPRHVTDGRPGSWKGSLDPGLSAAVVEKYRWWLRKYGYDVGEERSRPRRPPYTTLVESISRLEKIRSR